MYLKNLLDTFPTILKVASGSDLAVYLYLAYHFCCSEKDKISITLDEMHTELNLSRSTIVLSIKNLRRMRLLGRTKSKFVGSDGVLKTPSTYEVFLFDNKGKRTRFLAVDQIRPKIGPSPDRKSVQAQTENWPRSFNPSDMKELNPKKDLEIERLKKTTDLTSCSTKYPLLTSMPEFSGKANTPVDKFKEAATQLKFALVSRNKLMRKSNIDQWSRTFEKFLADNADCGWPRFKNTLNWYCSNIGIKYVPVARSADAFCKKFEGIEDAMERSNVSSTQSITEEETQAILHSDELPDDQKELEKQLDNDSLADLI